MVPILQIASPVLGIIAAVELILSAIFHPGQLDKKDTLANMTVGLLTLVTGILMKGIAIGYYYLCQEIALLNLGGQWWVWVLAMIGTDFTFYWFHRLGHEVRFLWAGHVTHHSSEKFNFSVAIRTPVSHQLYRYVFFGPLILIGFDPWMIITCDSVISIYQFLLHNEFVGKLGFIEKIFNTPSHHRVHHSSNTRYLDKNYGGILVIWDRLLGTCAEEDEKPVYGLTKPLKSYNPLVIAFHDLVAMFKEVWQAKSLKEVWMHMFGAPGWKDERQLSEHH